jgi:hypothetical protein
MNGAVIKMDMQVSLLYADFVSGIYPGVVQQDHGKVLFVDF